MQWWAPRLFDRRNFRQYIRTLFSQYGVRLYRSAAQMPVGTPEIPQLSTGIAVPFTLPCALSDLSNCSKMSFMTAAFVARRTFAYDDAVKFVRPSLAC
jgi:hypothetical protein